MDHLAKLIAIQTQDLPQFMAALEERYGKKWVEQNLSIVGILSEEAPSKSFQAFGYGDVVGLMKVAHSAIRSIAKMVTQAEGAKNTERENFMQVMRTLYAHIQADFSREGVPDVIFNAMTEPPDVDGVTPPPPPPPDAPAQEKQAD